MPPSTFLALPQATSAGEISLRDHFAGLALNGIIAADADMSVRAQDPNLNGHAYIAKTCYRLADAMLAARKAAL
jgi:hypothetical protein